MRSDFGNSIRSSRLLPRARSWPLGNTARITLTMGLITAALAQIAYLGIRLTRHGAATDSTPDLTVGDHVDLLAALAEESASRHPELSIEGPTVLLAFHSQCAHSRAVLSQWREWIAANAFQDHVTMLAVTTEPHSIAEQHLREYGITIPVMTIRATIGQVGARIAKKTPWVYAIASSGIVVYEGHGEEVDAAFRSVTNSRRHTYTLISPKE